MFLVHFVKPLWLSLEIKILLWDAHVDAVILSAETSVSAEDGKVCHWFFSSFNFTVCCLCRHSNKPTWRSAQWYFFIFLLRCWSCFKCHNGNCHYNFFQRIFWSSFWKVKSLDEQNEAHRCSCSLNTAVTICCLTATSSSVLNSNYKHWATAASSNFTNNPQTSNRMLQPLEGSVTLCLHWLLMSPHRILVIVVQMKRLSDKFFSIQACLLSNKCFLLGFYFVNNSLMWRWLLHHLNFNLKINTVVEIICNAEVDWNNN